MAGGRVLLRSIPLAVSALFLFKNARLATRYFCGLIQFRFFRRGELAELAFAKLSESERSNRHANKPQNFDSHYFKHAADLAVLAFVQHDFQPGVFLAAAQHAAPLGSQQLPSGAHAAL